ncbi:MAG: ligase [Myxococcales bacterium]|nr:ligase [Myxococcales bacterium]
MKSRVTVAGVSISNPDRVFYPDDGITKLELARYYEAIADHVVPHVKGRPLTLVRCEGTIANCRFMRHGRVWGPTALRRVKIQEQTKVGEYLVADDLAGVIALVQIDILEIHTWSSRADDVDRPDRIVIDLDPGAGVTFRDVVAAARRVRAKLESLGLESWVKTTGGAGLHVVAPLKPAADWQVCFEFSRALAGAVAREQPARLTTLMGKQNREGKIYLDYLRNNRTNTSVAAFSTRARPGAPVSVPVSWSELAKVRGWTVRTLPKMLARRRRDPWEGYFRCKQQLTAKMVRILGP